MKKRFDVVHHNGNILVVDKDCSNMPVGKLAYKDGVIFKPSSIHPYTTEREIIASSSLIEGIPLIKMEDNIQSVADELYQKWSIAIDGKIYMTKDLFTLAVQDKKLQKYTEEDIRKAIEEAQTTDEQMNYPSADDVIASLQPKIVSVDLECEEEFYDPEINAWVGKEDEDTINKRIVPKIIDGYVIVNEVHYEEK